MRLKFGTLGRACLLYFGFLLFGCGAAEEVESEVQEVAEEPIDTIEVNETEFSLDPADITLDQPGTYVFRAVNDGNAVHSLERSPTASVSACKEPSGHRPRRDHFYPLRAAYKRLEGPGGKGL